MVPVIKYLCVVAVLYFIVTFMTSCSAINNPTHPYISGKKAILVEGLASYNIGFVRNAYKDDLERLGYAVFSEPYTVQGPIKADLCIGHSFGAGRLMRSDVSCDLVITMDAREWKASNNDSYISKHIKHYNFYQSGSFRGYPIKGAINKEIKGVSHVGLPKKVKDDVMKKINFE